MSFNKLNSVSYPVYNFESPDSNEFAYIFQSLNFLTNNGVIAMFNNMKVGQRLGIGFGLVLMVLFVIVLISISRLASLNQDMQKLSGDLYLKTAIANELAYRTMDNARIVRNFILNTDENAMSSNKVAYYKNIETNSELFSQLDKIVDTEQAKEVLKEMIEARDVFRGYAKEVVTLALAHQGAEATKVLYGEKYKTQVAFLAAVKKFKEFQAARMEEGAKQASDHYESTRNLLIILSIAAIALGVTIAWLIIRSITGQLGGEPIDSANK